MEVAAEDEFIGEEDKVGWTYVQDMSWFCTVNPWDRRRHSLEQFRRSRV